MNIPSTTATAACCGLILIAPHLLGGATPAGTWFIAGGACVALAVALENARDLERKRFVVPAGWAAFALHAFTMVQTLPLPCSLVRWFAPGSASAVALARTVLQTQDLALCSLSYDPGATQMALGWTATVLSMIVASSILVQLGGRHLILMSVAASSLIMALSGLLHRLGSVDSVYGVYRPIYSHPRVLGPLLNENHLGAFILLGVPLMVALGVESERKGGRASWFIAAVLSTGTAVLTLSRGAFAMLLIEVALFLTMFRPRRTESARVRKILLAAVPCAGGIALGLYTAGEQLMAEFTDGNQSKLETIWAALKFTFHSPLFGVGRGAFGPAFTSVYGTITRAEYAESLLVQWVADWGWPMGVAAFGWFAWWLARALINANDTLEIAGLVGLLSLGFQNLVDFNIDMPGVAPVVAALFAGTVIPHREQLRARFTGDVLLARPVSVQQCAAMLLAAIVGCVWSVWMGVTDLSFEETYRQVQSRAASSGLLATIEQGVVRHPGDARYAVLAASVANAAQLDSAAGWISYARALAPGWAASYVLDAHRELRAGDAVAAAREVRLGAERDPNAVAEIICPAASALLAAGHRVETLLPPGEQAGVTADRLNDCDSIPLEARRGADRVVVEQHPEIWTARVRLASDRTASPRERIALLAPLAQRGHSAAMVYGLLAGAYDSLGQSEDAEACLKRGLEHSNQRYLVYSFLAARYGRNGDLDAMREALSAMRADGAESSAILADVYAREGAAEAEYGDKRRALAAFEKAYRLVPRKEWLVQLLAVATSLGNPIKIAWARAALCHGGDAGYCDNTGKLLGGTALP